MSNFVRYDVGLREIASCTQAVLEFVEKSQVDVNASIFWTIERTSGPAREPAAGPNLVREEHQLRLSARTTATNFDASSRGAWLSYCAVWGSWAYGELNSA
jgi:hypothetical protein